MAEEHPRGYHRFRTYQETRDPQLLAALVEEHLRLATHLARRFEHRGVPLEDLEQVASLGLLKAIERYEPERGLEFSTFATPTIVGEIKRYFRDKGWAIRVPRRIQELNIRLNAVIGELTQTLGRSPSIDEIALASRASAEEVLEAMEASQAYRSGSIDRSSEESDSVASQLGTEDDALFQAEDRLLLDQLLNRLSPREQLMVRLRYYEEMTQADIAARLGISQMHVSRLLARCLVVLREHLDTQRRRDGD